MTTKPRRILHILPVAVPPAALEAFVAQLPSQIIDPDVQIEFTAPARGARNMIDSAYERTVSDAAVLAAGAGAADKGFHAVVVNSMSDSGISGLRSRLDIPVVGACQASMALASCLGNRIGVVTMWPRWHTLYTAAAAAAGLTHRLVTVRDIGTRPDAEELLPDRYTVFPKLLDTCRQAVEHDGSDVLILGSTTMHPAHTYLARHLDVPLINPGVAAHQLAQQLLRAGLTHSRRSYPAPQRPDDDLLAAFASG
ncbi:aspartate/glutamate racemase family protein [Spirillospora sp. CA-128828]|uniref:aspartate/glutamate racemase family protein n=1 Tax=Spirillospora sp. CA-128828 TaxID=3240033 RepID=UPI003D8A22CF